jgi:hypothetical protein
MVGRFVVVRNHYIYSVGVGRIDRLMGSNAAIYGNDEVDPVRYGITGNGLSAEAVSFRPSVGNIVVDIFSGMREEFKQKGGSGHAVYIVVSKDKDFLLFPEGANDSRHRSVHILESKRRAKVLKRGMEKA